MPTDVFIHNRIVRLAADLTPAVFACLITYDASNDNITVASISGTNTKFFAHVNASARRSEAGWTPSVTAKATVNPVVEALVRDRKSTADTADKFVDGLISTPLAESTFAQFNDHWCQGFPIIIDDEIWGALIFVSKIRPTKAAQDSCQEFVDQCDVSISSMLSEQSLTSKIEKLSEQRRKVQLNDPLGLTQRRDATSKTPRSFGDIRLSHETQTAVRGDRELNLTRREFDLLDTFLQSPGTALSRIQIISRVWIERNGVSSNVLNVTIKNLREKLEAAGEPRVIHSLRAYGYVLKSS